METSDPVYILPIVPITSCMAKTSPCRTTCCIWLPHLSRPPSVQRSSRSFLWSSPPGHFARSWTRNFVEHLFPWVRRRCPDSVPVTHLWQERSRGDAVIFLGHPILWYVMSTCPAAGGEAHSDHVIRACTLSGPATVHGSHVAGSTGKANPSAVLPRGQSNCSSLKLAVKLQRSQALPNRAIHNSHTLLWGGKLY